MDFHDSVAFSAPHLCREPTRRNFFRGVGRYGTTPVCHKASILADEITSVPSITIIYGAVEVKKVRRLAGKPSLNPSIV